MGELISINHGVDSRAKSVFPEGGARRDEAMRVVDVVKPPTRPRLAFVGLGWIGRHRLQAIARSGLADIQVLVDSAADARDAARLVVPRARVAADMESLDGLELDGVIIATPSAMHGPQARRALENGWAVFCQKPLARTAEETAEVIGAARAANRLLGVDLSYRHTQGIQAIRRLIQQGELGRIHAIEMVFHNAYGPDKPWFYDAALAGGGCLMDLGTHMIDLALWCLGFPSLESASARMLCCGKPWRRMMNDGYTSSRTVEDYASAVMSFSNGAVVQLACSWKTPAGCDAHIEAKFYGSSGGAGFRNLYGSFYDFTAEHYLPDRSRTRLASPPDDWGGRAAVSWVRNLSQSAEFDPEIEQLCGVAEVIDGLYAQCS